MHQFLTRSLLTLGFGTIAICGPAVAQDKPMALPPGMTPAIMKMMMTTGPMHPKGLPADVVPVAGCIPAMGYHYAVPKNWPTGPIYGWYNGKPVFTEVMLTKTAFETGVNMDDILKPLPGYHIDHVDIHAWYIPHSAHMTFCKNPSGKRPIFV